MSKVNIKFLAQKLSMAPSTVSRALNDSYEISQATKDRVLQLAKELNYQPNPYARSLRAHKSKTIGVIIPERINNFFSQVIDGIEEITREYGYHLLVYNSHEDVEQEKKIISYLLSGRVDAIVMSVSSQTKSSEHLQLVQKQDIPLLFFDRIALDIPTTKFITNDYQSGYDATQHLIANGCQKICFLLLSLEITIGKERLRGYLDAIKSSKLSFDESWIIQCSQNEQANFDLLKALLYPLNRPDGIVSSVEKLAVTAYHVVKETKLKIPQDLKIISFSNMRIADLLDPPLSTISQPANEIGHQCAKLLMKKLADSSKLEITDQTIVLDSKIEFRKSSQG